MIRSRKFATILRKIFALLIQDIVVCKRITGISILQCAKQITLAVNGNLCEAENFLLDTKTADRRMALVYFTFAISEINPRSFAINANIARNLDNRMRKQSTVVFSALSDMLLQ